MLVPFKNFILEAAYKKNTRYTIESDVIGSFEVYSNKKDFDTYQEVEFIIEAKVSYYKPSYEDRVHKSPIELSVQLAKVYFNENFTLGEEKFKKGQEVTDAFLRKYCDTYKSLHQLTKDLEDEILLAAEDNL